MGDERVMAVIKFILRPSDFRDEDPSLLNFNPEKLLHLASCVGGKPPSERDPTLSYHL